MTVNQIEKKFITKDGSKVFYNRTGINKTLTQDIVRNYFSLSPAILGDKKRRKIEFNKIVEEHIHVKFCNIYKEISDTEWASFFASIVIPIKIALRFAEPIISSNDPEKTKKMNVNRYTADLSDTEKMTIVASGCAKLKVDVDVVHKHSDILQYYILNDIAKMQELMSETMTGTKNDNQIKEAVRFAIDFFDNSMYSNDLDLNNEYYKKFIAGDLNSFVHNLNATLFGAVDIVTKKGPLIVKGYVEKQKPKANKKYVKHPRPNKNEKSFKPGYKIFHSEM